MNRFQKRYDNCESENYTEYDQCRIDLASGRNKTINEKAVIEKRRPMIEIKSNKIADDFEAEYQEFIKNMLNNQNN